MPTDFFVNPGTYTWTAPAGVTTVTVVAIGAGGGGGTGDQGDGTVFYGGGGGGGGGGEYNTGDIPVTPGLDYTVIVGDFGAGQGWVAGGVNGGDGGDSSFTGNGGLNITGQGGSGGTGANDGLNGTGGNGGGVGDTNGGSGGDGQGGGAIGFDPPVPPGNGGGGGAPGFFNNTGVSGSSGNDGGAGGDNGDGDVGGDGGLSPGISANGNDGNGGTGAGTGGGGGSGSNFGFAAGSSGFGGAGFVSLTYSGGPVSYTYDASGILYFSNGAIANLEFNRVASGGLKFSNRAFARGPGEYVAFGNIAFGTTGASYKPKYIYTIAGGSLSFSNQSIATNVQFPCVTVTFPPPNLINGTCGTCVGIVGRYQMFWSNAYGAYVTVATACSGEPIFRVPLTSGTNLGHTLGSDWIYIGFGFTGVFPFTMVTMGPPGGTLCRGYPVDLTIATCSESVYAYDMIGGFAFSNGAIAKQTKWVYVASGGLNFSNTAATVRSNYIYSIAGGSLYFSNQSITFIEPPCLTVTLTGLTNGQPSGAPPFPCTNCVSLNQTYVLQLGTPGPGSYNSAIGWCEFDGAGGAKSPMIWLQYGVNYAQLYLFIMDDVVYFLDGWNMTYPATLPLQTPSFPHFCQGYPSSLTLYACAPNEYEYDANGTLNFGGSASLKPKYLYQASGTLRLSNSATVHAPNQYVAGGNLALGNSVSKTATIRYTASGSLRLLGSASTIQNYSYKSSGSLRLSNGDGVEPTYLYQASGSIHWSNSAILKPIYGYNSSGSLHFSNGANYHSTNYAYIASGSLYFSGTAKLLPTRKYTGSGSLYLNNRVIRAVTPQDLQWHYSVRTATAGNQLANTNPKLSLGGYLSTTKWVGTTKFDLFDLLDSDENNALQADYRCIFFVNGNPDASFVNVRVWISSLTPSGGTITLGADPAGVTSSTSSSQQASIINPDTQTPSGVVFIPATTPETGVVLGNISANQTSALWIKRTATNTAKNDAGFNLYVAIDVTGPSAPPPAFRPSYSYTPSGSIGSGDG